LGCGQRGARHLRFDHAGRRGPSRRPSRQRASVGAISPSLEFRPLDAATSAEVEAMILGDPELVRQLDVIARPGGVAYGLSDVHLAPEACSVAYRAGEVAGFTMGVRLNDAGGVPFAFLRLGVGERHRRHGVGSALLARAVAQLEASTPLREILIGAWIPGEAAERFVEHHRLVYSRTYWLMERPKGGMADAVWPDGIVMRTYDGSRRAIEGLTESAKHSFSEHDPFAPSTAGEALSLTPHADLRGAR